VVNITLSQLAGPAASDGPARSRAEPRPGAGEGRGTVITFDDVTDQVRMEEQLQRQDRLASIGPPRRGRRRTR
jgi:hypothetical protein